MDTLGQFKEMQKEGWKSFAPLETITVAAAARLVQFAGVSKGMRVLDVGCGTGVVALTAARAGAQVEAIDLTPELLERARANGITAGVSVQWQEGDAEQLPFGDGEFDVVLSQFAHIFAPRPQVVTGEMLRVLRSGGTIAFATWPPDLLVGKSMALGAQYLPPLPPGVSPPSLWGETHFVQTQLGDRVKDLAFERAALLVPALSVRHYRAHAERTVGSVRKMVETLSVSAPERLEEYRRQFDDIVEQYYRDNLVRQDYLLARARKI
ncbi:MAG TPA: class I SAM-dependent methyltransferase [Candidatus Solibacter sp.]|nr:class I SAM-dependent methyltransferase [Candidatus Solibacter sp.]